MDFQTLKQYKPAIPFRVVEKDLILDPELRKKTYFTDEDARIDHSKERLNKGEIEIPVFRDQTIRPLNFKGKLLDYQMENLGAGFYVITQKRGKVFPKPHDHQHANEIVEQKNTFFIAYDLVNQEYKYLENEKNFLQLYQEIEDLKNGEEVQKLINDFIDWIQTFWTAEYKEKHNFGTSTSKQTYQDHLNVIRDLKNTIPLLKKYHLLLNLFGDISDQTYEQIDKTLETLTERMDKATETIEDLFPDPNMLVDYGEFTKYGYGLNNPLTDVHHYIDNRILVRGYYLNRETKEISPTIGEIFAGNQFSTEYESDSSKKERLLELINTTIERTKNSFFKYTIEKK